MIAEVEAISADGIAVRGIVLSGVLIGEPEVSESCDGDKLRHSGKGALKVAENTNIATNDIAVGTDVLDTHVADKVTTEVDGIKDKLKSGVNVTSVALTVIVRVVVIVSDTLSHRPSGGTLGNRSFAFTTNTSNGGVYVVNIADA